MAKPLKSGVRNVKRGSARGAVRTRAGTYSIAFGGKVHYGFKSAAEANKAAAGKGIGKGGAQAAMAMKPKFNPKGSAGYKAGLKAPARAVKGKDLGGLLGKKPKKLPDLTAGKTPGTTIKSADLGKVLRKGGGPSGPMKGKTLTEALRAKKEKSAVTRKAKANKLRAGRKQTKMATRKAEAKSRGFKSRFLKGLNATRNVIGKGRETLSRVTGEAKDLFKPFLQGGGSSGGNKFSKFGRNNARYAKAGKVGGKYKHTRKGGGYTHKAVKNYNYEPRVKAAKKSNYSPT